MIIAPAGTEQSTVDRAEAMVLAHLQLETLESKVTTQSGRTSSQIITLAGGYGTELLDVSLGTLDLTDQSDLLAGRTVKLPYRPLLPQTYSVTYRSGWKPGRLPHGIVQAVLMTAEAGSAPEGLVDGLSMIRLPELELRFLAGYRAGSLTAAVEKLLLPWAPRRW